MRSKLFRMIVKSIGRSGGCLSVSRSIRWVCGFTRWIRWLRGVTRLSGGFVVLEGGSGGFVVLQGGSSGFVVLQRRPGVSCGGCLFDGCRKSKFPRRLTRIERYT